MTTGAALRVGIFGQAAAALAAEAQSNGKILVVLELSGGNDGLNTLVPYADDAYYKHRPKIGIPNEYQMQFFGDEAATDCWRQAVLKARSTLTQSELTEIDLAPFQRASSTVPETPPPAIWAAR